jgi:hypothetical protein
MQNRKRIKKELYILLRRKKNYGEELNVYRRERGKKCVTLEENPKNCGVNHLTLGTPQRIISLMCVEHLRSYASGAKYDRLE